MLLFLALAADELWILPFLALMYISNLLCFVLFFNLCFLYLQPPLDSSASSVLWHIPKIEPFTRRVMVLLPFFNLSHSNSYHRRLFTAINTIRWERVYEVNTLWFDSKLSTTMMMMMVVFGPILLVDVFTAHQIHFINSD